MFWITVLVGVFAHHLSFGACNETFQFQYPLSAHKVAFADPICSSGGQLPLSFASEDLGNPISVVSPRRDKRRIGYRSNGYSKAFSLGSAGVEPLANRLKKAGVEYLFYASDTALPWAERVATEMGLEHINDPNLIDQRSDKVAQKKWLQRNGVRVTPFELTTSVEDAIEFWRSNGEKWVVLKPRNSAGSDNVIFCNSTKKIVDAFNLISGSIGMKGENNGEVLIEAVIEGTEHAFNMISTVNPVSGKIVRRVTGIWEYDRQITSDGGTVYRHDILVPYTESIAKTVTASGIRVANLLGQKYGASHFEIFTLGNGETVFSEGAPRLSGVLPRLERQFTNRDPFQMTLDSKLRPEEIVGLSKGYKLKSIVAVVFLPALQEGVFTLKNLDEIRSLPGVTEINLEKKEGEKVSLTKHAFGYMGEIIVAHKDISVVRKTIKSIHRLREAGIFLR